MARIKGKTRAKVPRIRPVGESRLRRVGVNNGVALISAYALSMRTFNISDVPAMLEDDQVALGMDYLKIPIAHAPIAVKTSKPEAYGFACDLYERIWNALIPKLDIALAYGDGCYEPLYRKDPKNSNWWDFRDFDIAPPFSSVPWVNNEKLAFVAVHGSGQINTFASYWYDTGTLDHATILEGSGKLRPAKCLWVVNDCLLSRWFGRSVLRASHLRWKAKNMPDGAMENLVKAMYKASFSGLLFRYPANQSIVAEDGSIITTEQYADFICQVAKSGSNIRLPSHIKDAPGWDVDQYSKNLVDVEKLIAPLDYYDRGILRGMGIPDEILTHDGSTGGYSRSLISIDAFYSRGETRAETILPSVTENMVGPLIRQRYGLDCEVTAKILRAPRPDDTDGDNNNNGIPDSLEGAMKGRQPGDQMNGNHQPQPQFPPQGQQSRFSALIKEMSNGVALG